MGTPGLEMSKVNDGYGPLGRPFGHFFASPNSLQNINPVFYGSWADFGPKMGPKSTRNRENWSWKAVVFRPSFFY